LATSHALIHDMPVVTAGLLPWGSERFRSGLPGRQMPTVTSVYPMPMYMISTLPFVPVTWILSAAALAMVVSRRVGGTT
jgi:hypothetical protein